MTRDQAIEVIDLIIDSYHDESLSFELKPCQRWIAGTTHALELHCHDQGHDWVSADLIELDRFNNGKLTRLVNKLAKIALLRGQRP